MRAEEIRDTATLAGTTMGEVTDLVRDLHLGVSGRLFKLAGRPGSAIRRVHDGISTVVYTSTRVSLTKVTPAVGTAASVVRRPDAPSVRDSHRGTTVLGALNGAWGDWLAARQPALALPLTGRTHSGPRRRAASDLGRDLAAPTGRVAVFIHGLCESDRAWWARALKLWGDADSTHGSRLRADVGWEPVYITFNSGQRISASGKELSQFLEELVETWPVPVTEIALIGHSMGGLVIRSAAHQGEAATWSPLVKHAVYLGTPHMGAPLERVANRGSRLLGKLPETTRLKTWLNHRSVGIKDLRYGAITESDWDGWDEDDIVDRCTAIPLAPNAKHYYLGVTLSKKPDSPLARLVGDLLVQYPSASGNGKSRRLEFELDNGHHVGRLTHFGLLNNPQVYAQLRRWLSA